VPASHASDGRVSPTVVFTASLLLPATSSIFCHGAQAPDPVEADAEPTTTNDKPMAVTTLRPTSVRTPDG
jgi:hypothetical protein